MFDRRNRLANEVADQLRQHFPETLFRTIVPRNVRLAESPSYGMPVIEYDARCVGSEAYLALESIDGIGPNGVAAAAVAIARRVVKLQTGYVYHYAFLMLAGVAVIITWYLVLG